MKLYTKLYAISWKFILEKGESVPFLARTYQWTNIIGIQMSLDYINKFYLKLIFYKLALFTMI